MKEAMRPRSAAAARPGSSNPSRRRVEALSTQNKGFTAASAAKIAAELGPKEDPIAKRVNMDVLSESTRGFIVSEDMHANVDDEGRVRHYTLKIREFNEREYAEEWALCHYNLACIYNADRGGDIYANSDKPTREG